MPLLDRLLGWFGQKAMRAGAARLAQQSPTAETAGRALAIFEQNQHKSEVFIDTPAGLVRYTRADIDRLRRYARAGVGERVLGQALLGSSVYGYPGGWAQNRLEQVRHYTHWTYAAVDLYCSMVAGLSPSLAYVRSRGARRERRSGLQNGDLRFENVRGALPGAAPQGQSQISNLKSQIRSAKSLHAIKPHEDIEPAQDDHPLLELLRNPNSWDTTWDLFYELILFLRLTGNSYLWVVPNRLGMPCELWVMPSHWVWPRAGQDKLVEFYEIRPFVGQGILRIPAEEIIHFRFKSPLHKIDGYSPLVAAANETDVYESISLSQFYQFKNGSFPMGHLKLGRSYYDPDDRTLERHYAKWRQRFQGEARFGSTLITGDDVEFAPLMVQPKEMAYGESMAMMRDNILALHRVPKELVGLQPSGGDLSWYAPQYAFCRFSLTPLLQMIGQTMTQRLARRYDASLRLWYEDATPDNPAEVRANVSLGLEKGFLSPNEARTYLLGLEAWPNEAADMPWLNPQLAPLPLNQPGTLKDLEAGLSGWEKAAGAEKEPGPDSAAKTPAAEPANGEADGDELQAGHGVPGAKRFRVRNRDAHNKGSYFEICPRDEHGHCLPRGTADHDDKPAPPRSSRNDTPSNADPPAPSGQFAVGTNAALQESQPASVEAPVSAPLNMGAVHDALIRIHGSKERAQKDLNARAYISGGNAVIWSMQNLQDNAQRPRLAFGRVVDARDKNNQLIPGKKKMLASFLWGHEFTLDEYNGTVLQVFTYKQKALTIAGSTLNAEQTSAEGFLMTKGHTNPDVQTIGRSLDPAIFEKVEEEIDVQLGAGSYNGKGVTNGTFEIFKKSNDSGPLGKIGWKGKVYRYKLKLTMDNKGTVTFHGPFDAMPPK